MPNLNLIHPDTNERKIIPESWRPVFEKEMYRRGFKVINEYYFNPDKFDVALLRHTGGLGDILCIIPSVYELVAVYGQVHVFFPAEFEFLFREISGVTFHNYAEFKFYEIIKNFRHVWDLYCPAAAHETATNFRPTKNRIENFADFLGVPIGPISIPYSITRTPNARPRVLIQVRTANEAKDIPFGILTETYNALFDTCDSFFIDKEQLKGFPCLHSLNLEELCRAIYNSDLIIGGDSGLFHLASFLGVPALGIFGPTNGDLTTKYYHKTKFIQLPGVANGCHSPCYYSSYNSFSCTNKIGECMLLAEVNEILQLSYQLLSTSFPGIGSDNYSRK